MSLRDPFESFQVESIRFLSAQSFILRSSLIAMADDSALSQRFNRLEEAVQPTYNNSFEYLCSRLFIAHVSSFEIFIQETLTIVLKKHPKKIGSATFTLSEIIDAPDSDCMITRAIEDFLNRLMYKRPMEYLSEICDLLSISKDLLIAQWPVFVEAKARRDLGVHANWKCNATYLRKIQEVGLTSGLRLGELAVPNTDDYIESVADALDTLAEVITDQVILKYES